MKSGLKASHKAPGDATSQLTSNSAKKLRNARGRCVRATSPNAALYSESHDARPNLGMNAFKLNAFWTGCGAVVRLRVGRGGGNLESGLCALASAQGEGEGVVCARGRPACLKDQNILEVRDTASPHPPPSPHMTLLINKTRLYWICAVLAASLCSVPEANTVGGSAGRALRGTQS